MAKKIITIANHKGGVGKTTSVANIGDALSRDAHKVLLIDLDAQMNLTQIFLHHTESPTTIYDALIGKSAALPIIHAGRVDLVPSSVELSRIEMDLASVVGREHLLTHLLAPIAHHYDYIIIDTPPSLGILTLMALNSATDLFVPLTAEGLPLQGLQVLESLADIAHHNGGAPLSGIFFTRYNNRNLNNAVIDIVKERYHSLVFDTLVRENITVAEAHFTGELLYDYAPRCNGAQDYRRLTNEIIHRQ